MTSEPHNAFDNYVPPGAVPAFVGLGDENIAFEELPQETQSAIAGMIATMRAMYPINPLAFEAAIEFVAANFPAADHWPKSTPEDELDEIEGVE